MEEGIMAGQKQRRISSQIAVTAVLLAICIASQFFKGISVYITGPVINTCLVLAVFTAGLQWAVLLALITPVTAFLIAAAPIMQVIPGIIPLIMLGNIVLVFGADFLMKADFTRKKQYFTVRTVGGALLSALAKGAFMGLTISAWIIPTYLPEGSKLFGKIKVFQTTFSVTQFITACIGMVYVFLLWMPLRKILRSGDGMD